MFFNYIEIVFITYLHFLFLKRVILNLINISIHENSENLTQISFTVKK